MTSLTLFWESGEEIEMKTKVKQYQLKCYKEISVSFSMLD